MSKWKGPEDVGITLSQRNRALDLVEKMVSQYFIGSPIYEEAHALLDECREEEIECSKCGRIGHYLGDNPCRPEPTVRERVDAHVVSHGDGAWAIRGRQQLLADEIQAIKDRL